LIGPKAGEFFMETSKYYGIMDTLSQREEQEKSKSGKESRFK
jgi:hypothetical protein